MISAPQRWTAKRKYDFAIKWQRAKDRGSQLVSDATLALMALTKDEIESWCEIIATSPSYAVAIERLKATTHPREVRFG